MSVVSCITAERFISFHWFLQIITDDVCRRFIWQSKQTIVFQPVMSEITRQNSLNFWSISDIVMVTWCRRHGVAGSGLNTAYMALTEKHWQTELIPISSCTIFALSIVFHDNNIVALIVGRSHKRCQTESLVSAPTHLIISHARTHSTHVSEKKTYIAKTKEERHAFSMCYTLSHR